MAKKFFIFLVTLSFLGLPAFVQAASLYFDPAGGRYGPGDSFALDLLLETDRCLNTIEATLSFPKDYLNISDIFIGDSFLHLWINRPDEEAVKQANQTGILYFAGGTPGGYCGKIPGDPGLSNLVAKIVFKVPGLIVSDEPRETVTVGFVSSGTRALVNDGFGTEAELVLTEASFNITSSGQKPDKPWVDTLNRDTIPPEPFVIELHSNLDINEGAYYVIFNTTDKQSGLSHYEIIELNANEPIDQTGKRTLYERLFEEVPVSPVWEKANMPYVLKDQTLSSIIKVKAVDKAGNERIVEYIPYDSLRTVKEIPFVKRNFVLLLCLSGTIILLIPLVFYVSYRYKRKKHNKSKPADDYED